VCRGFSLVDCQGLSIKGVAYCDRLKALGLQSLQERRLRNDLIMTYQILFGYVSLNYEDFFTRSNVSVTRGHKHKLFVRRTRLDIHKYSFAHRVVEVWNCLPNNVVEAISLTGFKTRLNAVDLSKYVKGWEL
jgi:hypothetical protein